MGDFFDREKINLRKKYEDKYNKSRANLLIVIIFTLVNILLLITNADMYFLFSAFIPYFITTLGMVVCGKMPDDFYQGEFANIKFLDNYVFVVLLVIAIVLTLLYLLAWYKSSKYRGGWLIFALVFFSIDTSAMLVLNGIALSSIIDIIFHGWVIYYLIVGVSSYTNLKKLPNMPEDTSVNSRTETIVIDGEDPQILRRADTNVKYRVLLETTMYGCEICYRRVKRTNELVVNGYVYAEYEALIEKPHTLSARVGGHAIEVGNDGIHSFIRVDYREVKKKLDFSKKAEDFVPLPFNYIEKFLK